MELKYFSTFTGIGGFEKAMPKDWECVGYSEIDKYAIDVYQRHFPKHKNYGDITKIDIKKLPDFDLLVGGSPCQDLSIAKRGREGLDGSRSGLFYKYIKILKIKKPKYFILENVASMPKEARNQITEILGVQPVMIDAALVSAQQRKRYFWANFYIPQPKDRGIALKDILEYGYTEKLKSYAITATYARANPQDYFMKGNRQLIFKKPVRVGKIGKGGQGDRIYSIDGKSVALSANGGGRGAKTGLYKMKEYVRKLTPIECERLQCFPDNWTDGHSDNQRYKMAGNAVNVEVIKEIIKRLI